MKTIQDYFNSRSDCPDYVPLHLNKIDDVIRKLGFDWYTMSKQQWIDVFTVIQPPSFGVKNRYRNVAVLFLNWLEEQGEIAAKDNILAEYNPQLGIDIPFSKAQQYLPDLPTLLDAMERTSPARDSTILTNLATALLWYQFTPADCAGIGLNNVWFYKELEELPLETPLKDITRCIIKTNTAHAIINHPDVIRYAFAAFNRAHKNSPDAGLFQNKGEALTAKSILRRLQRNLDRINEYCNLELTITSIRLSGVYHKAYIGWKALGYGWQFNPYTRDEFSQLLGRYIGYEASYRGEFAKFISYVQATQDEEI